MTGAEVVTFVFDSTNGAMWAEEIARELGIPVEVVPAPSGAEAICDLAVSTLARETRRLEAAWSDQGVPFRAWSGAPA